MHACAQQNACACKCALPGGNACNDRQKLRWSSHPHVRICPLLPISLHRVGCPTARLHPRLATRHPRLFSRMDPALPLPLLLHMPRPGLGWPLTLSALAASSLPL
eukprot:1813758-Pleurochrysis_carterae.AAC.1